jgi:biopolymer transport protein TolR
MASQGQGGGGPKIGATPIRSEINVTPLVDVCLVLLIIFMVVTPMLQSGVDVNLPETNRPEKVQEGEKQLTIAIKADGQIFVQQNWVPKDNFAATIKQVYDQTPDKDVRIKADRYLKYAEVREIMKMVNEAGFAKAGLITMKKSGPAGAAPAEGG